MSCECDDCEAGIKPATRGIVVHVPLRHYQLDWDKIRTHEQLRELVQLMWQGISVVENSPAHHAIRKFVKDEPTP